MLLDRCTFSATTLFMITRIPSQILLRCFLRSIVFLARLARIFRLIALHIARRRHFWRLLDQLIHAVRSVVRTRENRSVAMGSRQEKRCCSSALSARVAGGSRLRNFSFYSSFLLIRTHARMRRRKQPAFSPAERTNGQRRARNNGKRRGSTSRDASPPRFPASPAAAAISPLVSAAVSPVSMTPSSISSPPLPLLLQFITSVLQSIIECHSRLGTVISTW